MKLQFVRCDQTSIALPLLVSGRNFTTDRSGIIANELLDYLSQEGIEVIPQNKSSIMIVTNQATDTKQNFNATSTRNRIMASTMSVDEYFDELIDKVREDYANL